MIQMWSNSKLESILIFLSKFQSFVCRIFAETKYPFYTFAKGTSVSEAK